MAESLTRAKIEKFVVRRRACGEVGSGPMGRRGHRLGPAASRLAGSTSWMFVYRPKGVGRSEPARKVTLGSWPTLTIDAARSAAQAMAGAVALKRDPAADLRDERNRERRIRVEGARRIRARDHAPQAGERRRRSCPRCAGVLRRSAAREIDALTRADLVGRIEALEDAGLPGAAADLRKHARSLLEWAVSRGLAPFNVMAGLRRPRSSAPSALEKRTRARRCRTRRSSPCGTASARWARSAECCGSGC